MLIGLCRANKKNSLMPLYNKLIQLFCIIKIFVLYLSCPILVNGQDSKNGFSLQSRSFRCTSKSVGLYEFDSAYFENSVVEEYSFTQSKAKVYIEPKTKGKFSGDNYLFYHNNNNETIKTKDSVSKCEKSSLEEMNNMIYGFQPSLMSIDWNGIAPSHIVGPSRLIFFVNHHRNKLQLTELDPTKFKSIRNVRAITYRGTITIGNEDWDIEVFYDVISLTEQDRKIDHELDTSDQVPLRIAVMDKRTHGQLAVDYYTINLIDGDNNNLDNSRLSGFDAFTLPVASDCYSVLSSKIDLDIPSNEISFIARSVDTLAEGDDDDELDSFEYLVSYSGNSDGTLRRDEILFDESGQLEQVLVSSSIYDVRSAYKYNIVNKADSDSLSIMSDTNKSNMPILEIKGDASKNDVDNNRQQCVAAKMGPEETKSYSYLSAVLGFGKVVEMGHAIVRGLDTIVYERETDQLPYWLFPAVTVQFNAYSQQSKESSKIYTIVYYFVNRLSMKQGGSNGNKTQTDHLGPLVQMDIMQRTKLSTIVDHIRQVDIYDFVWDLQDSPNGDKIESLFSVYDKCQYIDKNSAVVHEKKFATLKLLLKEISTSNLRPIAKDQNDDSFHTLIRHRSIRNNALMRTLGNTLNIPWPQMADIDSSLTTSNGNLLIAVSLKLSELPEQSFKVNFLNRIQPEIMSDKPIYDVQTESFGVHSLEDCTWRAVHSSRVIKFIFCPGKCLLLSSKRRSNYSNDNYNPTGINSEDYEQQFASQNGICSLYAVERKESISTSSFLTNGEVYSIDTLQYKLAKYRHQAVNLLLPTIILPHDSSAHEFSIERIQLDEDIPTGSVQKSPEEKSTTSEQYESGHLNGLGFVWPSPQLRHVHPANSRGKKPEIDGQNYDNNYNNQHTMERSMDLTQCHSACLMDFDCRSFSLCLNGGQYECTLSGQSFKNHHLLQEIEFKQKQWQNRNELDTQYDLKDSQAQQAGLIYIDLESGFPSDFKQSETYQDSIQAGVKSVNLKIDQRCNIYNRNYLESFIKMYQAGIVTDRKSLVQVGSLEECARLCYLANVDYLHKKQAPIDGNSSLPMSTKKLCPEFRYDKDNNYCLTNHTPARNEEESEKLIVDTYKLDHKSLFTREYGFRFKSGTEMAKDGRDDDIQRYPVNFQRVWQPQSGDPQDCAQICFFASGALDERLACKSFDFIIKFDKKLKRNFYECQLNNISWSDISLKGQDYNHYYLVYENEVDSDVKSLWHYEPRLKLETSKIGDKFRARFRNDEELDPNRGYKRNVYSTMILLFVSITLGVVIGLYSTRYYLVYFSGENHSPVAYVMERNTTNSKQGNSTSYNNDPCCSSSLKANIDNPVKYDINHIEIPRLDLISIEMANQKDELSNGEL